MVLFPLESKKGWRQGVKNQYSLHLFQRPRQEGAHTHFHNDWTPAEIFTSHVHTFAEITVFLWKISPVQMWPFCTIKSNVMQKCIAYWKHVAILPKSDSVHNKCIFKEMQSLKSDNLLCQLHIYKHICREMSNCSMKCFYICKYEFQSVG